MVIELITLYDVVIGGATKVSIRIQEVILFSLHVEFKA